MKDKVSSLNKFMGVFIQRHSFMKATYRLYVTLLYFTLLFLFSFVPGLVFHEDKVSSLNKFMGVFTQRHSFMKATYRLYA